ncbi:MAG: cysteine--tRNA ligase [Actinobacteria bacterium HGW-Actinobacteria-1]|jgi:cysteinyl-tRNA synthetase|nr:MAG: cysteine--tRNA ligase [Actinobacteria bacterium HGW-Actinobacteria-1]
MAIRVYNTMTRTKEAFVPRDPDKVAMYVCGPTVYNHIHIGNARTFLTFDIIRRYLAWRGFDVTFVQNVTDVDDKIIKRAAEEGVPAAEVAETYTAAFRSAMEALGIEKPSRQPLATQTIPQMIGMVERLIATGHAYVVDGDVYFSVRSFPGYGKLSGRDIDDLESGARVEVDERKQDPLDFALWKSAKPGEPRWPSPWGEGRPGWHLECSVMSEEELGLPFDIHGGASDLIFPHHENELAQSEAATGTPFVKYWLHGGLLQVNAEKMSKSLGNFMLLKDVLEVYPAPIVRLFMMQTHYRSPLEFSTDRLDEARTAYERIAGPLRDLEIAKRSRARERAGDTESSGVWVTRLAKAIEDSKGRFTEEMDDDFNTAGALAAVFGLVREMNAFIWEGPGIGAHGENLPLLERAAAAIKEPLDVLGIEIEARPTRVSEYPPEVLQLAQDYAGYAGTDGAEAVNALRKARDVARSERNWAMADSMRDRLQDLGFIVEDKPDGTHITYGR